MLQQLSHSPSPQSTSLTAADTFSNVVGGSHVAAHSNASEPIEPSSAVTTSCVVYEGDLRSAADTGMLTGGSLLLLLLILLLSMLQQGQCRRRLLAADLASLLLVVVEILYPVES